MLPWHSVNSVVYHTSYRCTEGNNIEFWNRRSGMGGRVKCWSCITLERPSPTPFLDALRRSLYV